LSIEPGFAVQAGSTVDLGELAGWNLTTHPNDLGFRRSPQRASFFEFRPHISCSGEVPINLTWIGQRLGPALESVQWLIWLLLAGSLILGLLAVINPDRFRAIASGGARWVDTNKFLQRLDEPVNIDQFVFRHSRSFGIAVVLASLFLAYLCAAHFLF
jgi:hypothetical protein